MKQNIINYNDDEKLNTLFTGRTVTSDLLTRVITLDNGAKIAVVPNKGSSSSSGDYFIESLDWHSFAITHVAVKKRMDKHPGRRDTSYILYAYTAGIPYNMGGRSRIAHITGTDGDGKSGTGFILEVIED